MKRTLFTIAILSLLFCGCSKYDELNDTTGTGDNMYRSWKYATSCIIDDAAFVFACNTWIEADKIGDENTKEYIENMFFDGANMSKTENGIYELYKFGSLLYRIETDNRSLHDSDADWSIRRCNYNYTPDDSELVCPTFFEEGNQYVFHIKYAGISSWDITMDSTAYNLNSAEWNITLPTGVEPTKLNKCSYELTGNGQYCYSVYSTNDTRTTYTITEPMRQSPNSSFTPKKGKVSITAYRAEYDNLNVEAEILSAYSYKITYRGNEHVYED